MRLNSITGDNIRTILLESINKTDFFDFYALEYAANSQYQPDPETQKEIYKRLKETTEYIYNDLIRQYAKILIERFADTYVKGRERLYTVYGLAIEKDTKTDKISVKGLDNLSISQQTELIKKVLKTRKLASSFTTATWKNLALKFLEVSNAQSLRDKILTIDRVYGFAHHGGLLTDYMDEKSWIDDALNFRARATIDQILSNASYGIKELIGHYGTVAKPITYLELLRVAIDRLVELENYDIECVEKDDKLIILANVNYWESSGEPELQLIVPKGRKWVESEKRFVGPEPYYILLPNKSRANVSEKGKSRLQKVNGFKPPKVILFKMTISYKNNKLIIRTDYGSLSLPFINDGEKLGKRDLANMILQIPASTLSGGKIAVYDWGKYTEDDVTPDMRRYSEKEYNISKREDYAKLGRKVDGEGNITWVGKRKNG